MNTRSRVLMLVLLLIAGVGTLTLGVVFGFARPLAADQARIRKLHEQIEKQREEIESFHREHTKLVLAGSKGLPGNSTHAANEYLAYLHDVFNDSGLACEDMSLSPISKIKSPPTIPGVKEVGHEVITITVRARGELAQLVAVLQRIHTTAFLHRVKDLRIERPDSVREDSAPSPRLNISMVIETLLIGKSAGKSGPSPDWNDAILDTLTAQFGAPTGWSMLAASIPSRMSSPTPANREYAEIAQKNMFAGYQKESTLSESAPTSKSGPDVIVCNFPFIDVQALRYCYLTHTDPEQQTAYWRNRATRSSEQKLMARADSGYDRFRIRNDDGDYIFLQAKVIRVDLRVLYFQKERSIFAWHIGTSLEESLANGPILATQFDALQLKLDEAYAVELKSKGNGK